MAKIIYQHNQSSTDAQARSNLIERMIGFITDVKKFIFKKVDGNYEYVPTDSALLDQDQDYAGKIGLNSSVFPSVETIKEALELLKGSVSSSNSPTFEDRGTWDQFIEYNFGDIVLYADKLYISRSDGLEDKQPDIEPSHWASLDSAVALIMGVADTTTIDVNIDSNGILTASVKVGSIGTGELANDSVTSSKLGTSSVTSTKIADLAVTSAKINDNAVTLSKLASNSVDASKIVDGSVGTSELANSSVTNAKLADNAVTTLKIVDGAITIAKIAPANLNSPSGLVQLGVDGLVPSSLLPAFVDDVLEGTYINSTTFNNLSGVPYTPETGKIYVDTTTDKQYRWSGSAYRIIGDGTASGVAGGDLEGTYPNPTIKLLAVTTTKLADLSVTTGKLADNSVTSVKIVDSNVTTAKIANNAVTNAKLATMALQTVKVNATGSSAVPTDLSLSTNSFLGRIGGNIQNIAVNANSILARLGGNIVNLLFKGDTTGDSVAKQILSTNNTLYNNRIYQDPTDWGLRSDPEIQFLSGIDATNVNLEVTYPIGVSVFSHSTNLGGALPEGFGSIWTYRSSSVRLVQKCYPKTTNKSWQRVYDFDTSTWSNWIDALANGSSMVGLYVITNEATFETFLMGSESDKTGIWHWTSEVNFSANKTYNYINDCLVVASGFTFRYTANDVLVEFNSGAGRLMFDTPFAVTSDTNTRTGCEFRASEFWCTAFLNRSARNALAQRIKTTGKFYINGIYADALHPDFTFADHKTAHGSVTGTNFFNFLAWKVGRFALGALLGVDTSIDWDNLQTSDNGKVLGIVNKKIGLVNSGGGGSHKNNWQQEWFQDTSTATYSIMGIVQSHLPYPAGATILKVLSPNYDCSVQDIKAYFGTVNGSTTGFTFILESEDGSIDYCTATCSVTATNDVARTLTISSQTTIPANTSLRVIISGIGGGAQRNKVVFYFKEV
jgi:hypothetical protein